MWRMTEADAIGWEFTEDDFRGDSCAKCGLSMDRDLGELCPKCEDEELDHG